MITSIPSRFAERADEGESPVATAWKSSDFMNPKKGGTLPISFPPNNLPEIFHNWCNWCHELHLNVNMFLWKLELVCIVFQCLIRWTFAPSQEWQGCRGSLETFICHCYSKKGPRPIYIYIYIDYHWFSNRTATVGDMISSDFLDIMIEVTLDKTITGCH